MLITDAQVHIWEVDRPDRPWAEVRPIPPQKPNGYSAEDVLAEMDAAGVDRAVIVTPSWVGENNATGLEAAQAYPKRLAMMGRINPTAPDTLERLETWLDQPGMLGIRLTLHLKPWVDWLEPGRVDDFWAACERLGIPLMVNIPGLADKVHPLADRHPNLKLIIDHMGRTGPAKDEAQFRNLDDTLSLARHPNMFIKVTSFPSYSSEPYPFRNMHGYIRRIYDAFGSRRMFWGSDITRLPVPYVECLDLFRKELNFLSSEDREWILGRGIAETLNWPEA